MNHKRFLIGVLSLLFMLPISAQKTESRLDSITPRLTTYDYTEELNEIRMHIPNVEVGKGVSFQPKNKSYKLTMRIRMQNLVSVGFNDKFQAQDVDAQVKRLRLRFDGYIYSPKLSYSVQLGFTPSDTKATPDGNINIVRDAMIYYIPNPSWNIGFGQTKIRANRASLNSSSALQFVDRSIVNSEFNPDLDFGLFGEYNARLGNTFALGAKASVTTGDGRNWGNVKGSGLAYTGRLELFPFGRFSAKGDVIEGDYEREESPKILLAGAFSYNDRAMRMQGSKGSKVPDNTGHNLSTYYADFIFKYQGFAFYTDVMGRLASSPVIQTPDGEKKYILTGTGVNVQTSYIFPSNWEIALRNSTIIPDKEVREGINYRTYNQSTFGVTKYLIGHQLKVQADISYNYKNQYSPSAYDRWQLRFQVELGF